MHGFVPEAVMARVAVVFDNSSEQAVRIAHRIADVLRGRGHSVALSDLRSLLDTFSLRTFDAVVVGARIRFGRYPRRLRAFAAANADTLSRMQAWLFTVAAARPAAAPAQIERLERQTGWMPQRMAWLDSDWPAVREFAVTFADRLPAEPSKQDLPLAEIDANAPTVISRV
jgi:menaquinone-dependent protoporphyrinogen IX oxidase